MEEKLVAGSTTTWNDYVQAAGSLVAMRALAGSSASYLYFTGDHMGSIAIITDAIIRYEIRVTRCGKGIVSRL
jgi:hypothetical protein